MSSPSSPCAACKFLRRKCTPECVFAPYFPPDQPQRFANVHKVFGASNVSKLLHELEAPQREDAVNSLAYEAEARLRDPVYGCVGLISVLQHRLKQVQSDLYHAKKELASYIGSQLHHQSLNVAVLGSNVIAGGSNSSGPNSSVVMPLMGANFVPPQHQFQVYEPQQLAAVLAAREQREMMRSGYDQINNSGFSYSASSVNSTGFNHIGNSSSSSTGDNIAPSLALGGFDSSSYQIHHQSSQVLVQPSQQDEVKPMVLAQQQSRNGSDEEDRSNINT